MSRHDELKQIAGLLRTLNLRDEALVVDDAVEYMESAHAALDDYCSARAVMTFDEFRPWVRKANEEKD